MTHDDLAIKARRCPDLGYLAVWLDKTALQILFDDCPQTTSGRHRGVARALQRILYWYGREKDWWQHEVERRLKE